MSNDNNRATQQGARDDDDRNATEVISQHEQPVSDRDRLMAEMEARRDAELASGVDLDAPVDETAKEPTADEQLAAQLATDAPTMLADGYDKYRVKVKIDGQESDVSLDEVLRQYQKNGAADKRLADATRLLEEAKKTTAAPTAKPEPETKPASNPEAENEFIAAMFSGDEETARKAFREAVNQGRPEKPIPTVAEIVAAAAPALKQQLVVESAWEKFQTDYAEIAVDPYLRAKADELLSAEVERGTPLDKAFDLAGKGTRDWLSSKTGVAPTGTTTPTTARNERLERKAGIDSIPATSAKAVVAQEREPNHSDIVAEMRAARGQA